MARTADFPVGTKVRIKPRDFLQELQRTWKFHDPLQTSNWITLDRSPRSIRLAITSAQTNFTHYKAFAESGMNLSIESIKNSN